MRKTCKGTKNLLMKINRLRKKMICIGMAKGLSHPETLKYSEELDELIYKFQK
ncbi:aspartyl-phosphate phosphatase Spo0E family protein [Neobacillus niacini]|nr:aspartyl-phosphate phosphatase Spo0E family protein [Neobacillus niacini]MEC1522603.1 aspartyl-phosphate phosphatase Spo0E family protein [Neobacillus niacini]